MMIYKLLTLKLIKAYQNFKPLRNSLMGFLTLNTGNVATCRFQPSCSQYTYDAVEKYGTFQGLVKGLKRIFKCHPLSVGGFDPLI